MTSRPFCAVVLAVALIFVTSGPASAKNTCLDQGSNCSHLVYRGLTYPYERLDTSYLYVNAGVYPYVTITDNLLGDSTVRLPDDSVITVEKLLAKLGLPEKSDITLAPVVGYGSNPAPAQLERKFRAKSLKGDVVVPVMKGRLKDFDVAWTPVFVSYGAMPSTITRSPGTEVDVWITWLDEEAVKAMDATERADPARRPLYVRSKLEGATYQFDGPQPEFIELYVSCFGPLTIDGKTYAVDAVPAKGRKFLPLSSPEALKAVLPILEWEGDVLELLYDNVVSPENRAQRSTQLKSYGSFPDLPGAEGLAACEQSRTGAEKPY